MAYLSVTEAAERLGVHPQRVYQRITDGSLPAERVGQRLLIDERDLERVRHRTAQRAWSGKSAWFALLWAADLRRNDFSSVERSRSKARVVSLLEKTRTRSEELDLAAATIANALRKRARRHTFRASPLDLADVLNDERVTPAGLSLPESGMASSHLVEGYVADRHMEDLEHDYLLSPVPVHEANVVLHVPEGLAEASARLTAWRCALDVADGNGDDRPALNSEMELVRALVRTPLLLAADLAEHEGVRERHQALKSLTLLEEALHGESPRRENSP